MMVTTNAMRLLTRAGIDFTPLKYAYSEDDLSGDHAAHELGMDPGMVFKTLVLRGERRGIFVCCIPVSEELDLRKAAKAIGDKRAELIPLRELTPLTGYVRGGCSPVGMKKSYPTIMDETAQLYDAITVSAGVRGQLLLLDPARLAEFTGAAMADLCASV